MLDLLFVGLLQAAMGDPAAPAETAPATEQTEQAVPEPRTERRRVCQRIRATGERIARNVCTYQTVIVEPEEAEDAAEAGGAPAAPAPNAADPN